MPFDLSLDPDQDFQFNRELVLVPINDQVNKFTKSLSIQKLGLESDQLSLSVVHRNKDIAQAYLNGLILSFDLDVFDRELEYSRTIEFVNKREKYLKLT